MDSYQNFNWLISFHTLVEVHLAPVLYFLKELLSWGLALGSFVLLVYMALTYRRTKKEVEALKDKMDTGILADIIESLALDISLQDRGARLGVRVSDDALNQEINVRECYTVAGMALASMLIIITGGFWGVIWLCVSGVYCFGIHSLSYDVVDLFWKDYVPTDED